MPAFVPNTVCIRKKIEFGSKKNARVDSALSRPSRYSLREAQQARNKSKASKVGLWVVTGGSASRLPSKTSQ
jgi:hypothetical protein